VAVEITSVSECVVEPLLAEAAGTIISPMTMHSTNTLRFFIVLDVFIVFGVFIVFEVVIISPKGVRNDGYKFSVQSL
jgi:hypothetical protein